MSGSASLRALVQVSVVFSRAQAKAASQPPAKTAPPPAPKDTTPAANLLPVDGVAAIVGDQVVLISEVSAEAMRRRSSGYPVKSRENDK